jgi:gliding motility-associated protein GldM
MGHGKETPRQKMIGMMYLVLTAMLAMNVSAEVLDAFVLVENGLSRTTKSFTIKNEKLYDQIEKSHLLNPVKVGPWKEKADNIRTQAADLVKYVQDLKVEVIVTAEKDNKDALKENNEVDPAGIKKKSDTNVGSQVLIGPTRSGKAFELKKRIVDFREYLVSLVDVNRAPQLIESINSILNTEDPPRKDDGTVHTWETTRFDHLPLVAVFPQLTKVQVDVLNLESEVVTYLLQQVDADDFKVNKLDAIVIPTSNYVIQGNEFAAEIFLAASDTTQKPVISVGRVEQFKNESGAVDYRIVGGAEKLPIVNGRGVFKQRASRLGNNPWTGIVEVTAPNGTTIRKPFKHEFLVETPNIVISPTKMNVFYLGIENPVDISISGIAKDKISASIDRGVIKKKGDSFEVVPGAGANTCNITVTAEVDGQKRNMGSKTFRIKKVPNPMPKVIGVSGKTVPKNLLAASLGVVAEMPADFDFEMKFTVTEFTVSANIGGFLQEKSTKGQLFTGEQKTVMNNLKGGQQLVITNVKAVGPDGASRDLTDLVFKIQ